MNNKTIFEELFKAGKIKVRGSDLFNAPVEMKTPVNFDRIEGMLLGGAIGDSLGFPTENMQPRERLAAHGEIIDYLPMGEETRGVPSDETQFTMWTLEQIIKDGSFNAEAAAGSFLNKKIIGMSKTIKEFLTNFHKHGKKWNEAGSDSANSCSMMRVTPLILAQLKDRDANLWIDTALCSMMTNNDPAAIGSCAALLNLILAAMNMEKAPEPMFWLDKFIETLKEFETDIAYKPRCAPYRGYSGPLSGYLDKIVREAYDEGLTVLEACAKWQSGSYLLETVPCVLYILMKNGDNFENAIVRAVNDTDDNDTIAAIAGSVMGALYGKSGIPKRWVDNLSGRTGVSDDGKIFEIIRSAEEFLKK